VQVPKREDEDWSTGFVGFLTDEELFCVARHAREPNRVCTFPSSSLFTSPKTDLKFRVPMPARSPSEPMSRSSAQSGR
jgi:hypothetical protein